jgi:hypothetical protein
MVSQLKNEYMTVLILTSIFIGNDLWLVLYYRLHVSLQEWRLLLRLLAL